MTLEALRDYPWITPVRFGGSSHRIAEHFLEQGLAPPEFVLHLESISLAIPAGSALSALIRVPCGRRLRARRPAASTATEFELPIPPYLGRWICETLSERPDDLRGGRRARRFFRR
jgi:hypothetical protein